MNLDYRCRSLVGLLLRCQKPGRQLNIRSPAFATDQLCNYEASPPKNEFCYCWSEGKGNRRRNDIGTCILRWLEQLPIAIKEVSRFSDTCGGQNRNQNVAALLLHSVQTLTVEVIYQNLLESGHTMMECDSMQAAI